MPSRDKTQPWKRDKRVSPPIRKPGIPGDDRLLRVSPDAKKLPPPAGMSRPMDRRLVAALRNPARRVRSRFIRRADISLSAASLLNASVCSVLVAARTKTLPATTNLRENPTSLPLHRKLKVPIPIGLMVMAPRMEHSDSQQVGRATKPPGLHRSRPQLKDLHSRDAAHDTHDPSASVLPSVRQAHASYPSTSIGCTTMSRPRIQKISR